MQGIDKQQVLGLGGLGGIRVGVVLEHLGGIDLAVRPDHVLVEFQFVDVRRTPEHLHHRQGTVGVQLLVQDVHASGRYRDVETAAQVPGPQCQCRPLRPYRRRHAHQVMRRRELLRRQGAHRVAGDPQVQALYRLLHKLPVDLGHRCRQGFSCCVRPSEVRGRPDRLGFVVAEVALDTYLVAGDVAPILLLHRVEVLKLEHVAVICRLELLHGVGIVLGFGLGDLAQALEPVQHLEAPADRPDDGVLYRVVVRHDGVAVEPVAGVERQAVVGQTPLDQELLACLYVGAAGLRVGRPCQQRLSVRRIGRADDHLLEERVRHFFDRLFEALDEHDPPLPFPVVDLVHLAHPRQAVCRLQRLPLGVVGRLLLLVCREYRRGRGLLLRQP